MRIHTSSIVALTLILAGAARAAEAPKLTLEQAAPEISAVTAENKPVTWASIRAEHDGKVIVLQFGSATDPIFRTRVATVEKLATKLKDKAAFYVLYQKEAHAADSDQALDVNMNDGYAIAEPTSLAERIKLATDTMSRLKIQHQTLIIDTWNNASTLRYGGYANMTFIVDAKGKLQAGYPFMDPAKVEAAVNLLADGKTLSPELKGPTQRNGPAAFDFASAAGDVTGGRGPAAVAAILDRVSLTEQQRLTLFPALADFLADVQTFRQTRQAVPAAQLPARGPATAPARAGRGAPAASAPAGGQDTKTEVKTPEDLQAAQAALRASAKRVQAIIKQVMPEKDATQLLEALDNMVPAQRVFAN